RTRTHTHRGRSGSLAGLRLCMVMHVGNGGGSRAWQGLLGRRPDWGIGPPRSTGVRKGSFCGNGGQAKTRGGPEGGRGRPGVTSLGRCREPLVSGQWKAACSVLALPDGDNLVDGEVSVLESEHAGCEVEQPRACSGWGDESLSVLP